MQDDAWSYLSPIERTRLHLSTHRRQPSIKTAPFAWKFHKIRKLFNTLNTVLLVPSLTHANISTALDQFLSSFKYPTDGLGSAAAPTHTSGKRNTINRRDRSSCFFECGVVACQARCSRCSD